MQHFVFPLSFSPKYSWKLNRMSELPCYVSSLAVGSIPWMLLNTLQHALSWFPRLFVPLILILWFLYVRYYKLQYGLVVLWSKLGQENKEKKYCLRDKELQEFFHLSRTAQFGQAFVFLKLGWAGIFFVLGLFLRHHLSPFHGKYLQLDDLLKKDLHLCLAIPSHPCSPLLCSLFHSHPLLPFPCIRS